MKTFLLSIIALAISTSAFAQVPTVKTMLELVDSTNEGQRHAILAKVGYAYKFVKTEEYFWGMQGYKAKTFVPKNAIDNSENTDIIMTSQDKGYIGVDYCTTVKENYEILLNSIKAVGFVPNPRFKKKQSEKYISLHNRSKYFKTFITAFIVEKDGKTFYYIDVVQYPLYKEDDQFNFDINPLFKKDN